MPGQEQQRPSRREDEVEDAAAVPAQAKATETDADVDALLDEIDEVLESNSEEFVRGFVQKGGQ
ncbi:ubiquitin-like protein Pup [Kineococcus rhizosphaerae]|uniref:Prokaryotic ubiquitin-like protein Pup n=1 Tax=Kineococcus rhizosphaerae TaxID=559628 RepID=A0A2T0RAC3_9ACTN|nr:ubiquitin-like protein Pup [Kineococcus rhizosphaerae]PRY18104.1 ubiquitin-like protein Pup [Kineococcus rhizosphaerae]